MIEWLRQSLVVAGVEGKVQVLSPVWRLAVGLSMALALVAAMAAAQTLERQSNEGHVLSTRRAEAAEHGQRVISGFQRDEALRMIRPVAPGSALVQSGEGTQYRDPGPDGLTFGIVVPDRGAAANALDLEFILRAIIGLLATVIGAGSIVAARHRGTTKSLVSLPVRPSALMAGVLLGGLGAISAAAVMPVLTSLLVHWLTSPRGTTTMIVGPAIVLWVTATIFGAALQCIGSLAALRARTADRALAVAVGAWLLTAVVGIPIVDGVASSIAPMPPRALFEAERLVEHRNMAADLEFAVGDLVLEDVGPAGLSSAARIDGPLLAKIETLLNSGTQQMRSTLDAMEAAQRHGQVVAAQWRAWLKAPLAGALFRSAAAELAGVGSRAALRWERDTTAYQRALNAAVYDRRPRINYRVRRDAGAFSTYFHDRGQRPRVAELPVFVPHQPALRTQVLDAAPSLALLCLHTAVLALLAMWAFVRGQAKHGDWT